MAAFWAAFSLVVAEPASAASDSVGVWRPLVERLSADGIDRGYVESVFSRESMEFKPDYMARKMSVLLKSKREAKKILPPAPPKVLSRYLNPVLLSGGYAFYREQLPVLKAVEGIYGVPPEIVTALLLVETKLGVSVGKHKPFMVLASMSLAGDFRLIADKVDTAGIDAGMKEWLVKRTVQKGNWAYEEMKALIEYARNNNLDPLGIPGSVYGAIGLCQFMPTTVRHYGVDGSGDGRIDLFNTTDAIYSIGNFLKRHGWKPDMTEEKKLKVIYRYNHSTSYAMTILEVASRIRSTARFFEGVGI